MFRRVRLLTLCFALLALAWAQVFGLMRGYICDCGGEVSITTVDHCHGPHGAQCHDLSREIEYPHHHDGVPTNDTTHQHDVLKETVVAHPKLHVAAAPLPAIMLIAELPNLTLPTLALNCLYTDRSADIESPPDGKRPWPKVLTHTIALRV